MTRRFHLSARLAAAGALIAALAVVLVVSACETRKAEAACNADTLECLPKISLLDTANEVHPHEDLVGKVVVINFWATWCKPCKREIPGFNRVYEKYKDRDVQMFGVLTEDISNADILNFASDFEMTYPVVRLDQELALEFGLPPNIPVTFVYDKHGKRRLNKVGALEEQELAGLLDRLLAEN